MLASNILLIVATQLLPFFLPLQHCAVAHKFLQAESTAQVFFMVLISGYLMHAQVQAAAVEEEGGARKGV